MGKIGIVILTYNGAENTIECLESINKLSKDNFEILVVVVDNASTTEFRIQNWEFRIGKLKIIRNEKNFGYAGGNNVGIKYCLDQSADYVLLLNNDTIVDKNLILELLKVAQPDAKKSIVVPKIYFAKGYEFHKDRYSEEEKGKVIWFAGGIMDWQNMIGFHLGVDEVDNSQYEKEEETEIATGCCMLVRKEVFDKIGLLDEKYFLYYEDNDFSQRAKEKGFKIVYAPKAILWHKNAGSSGGSGSSLQDYYITRNRLIFGIKYAPLRSKLALLKESLKLLLSGRKWQRQGVLDFYFGRFGKGSYE